MIAKVTVVCDSRRHSGKVAKVSTFYVQDGAVTARDNGRRPRGRRDQRMKVDPLGPKSIRFFQGADTEVPACNLCGRSLPDDPRVNRAVVTIAAQGGHTFTATLSEVAATIYRLEA